MCKWVFLFLVPSSAMRLWLNEFLFLFLDFKENCFIGEFTTSVETFPFLSFPFLSFSSFLPLTLFLFLSFPFFPQVFAWLDLSWNKSNSTQGWILSSQNLIPFLISSTGINLLFPLLDCHSCISVSDFVFPRSSSCFLIPTSFIFVVFYFCFNSYIPSTFFRIFSL